MEASWAAASAALTRLPFEDSKPDQISALHCYTARDEPAPKSPVETN